MLNKTDKYFLISAITMFTLLAFSLFFALLFMLANEKMLLEIIFRFIDILTFFILPISILIQISTFFIKIFSKNKTIKDWIILVINLLLLFFFLILFLMLYIAATNPLL